MAPEIHSKPFTDETQDKLKIIKAYFIDAIPVFLQHSYFHHLIIGDLFSGPGTDTDGNDGTPLIILRALWSHREKLERSSCSVSVIFNDNKKAKTQSLHLLTQEWDQIIPRVSIEIFNEDAEDLFSTLQPRLRAPNTGSILCLDQYGIDFVNKQRFRALLGTSHCDTIFFLASSYVRRFSVDFAPRFDIPPDIASVCQPHQVHDLVCSSYEKLIPSSIEAYVSRYKIHKKSNNYGLVFLTHSLLGLEKFVKICWRTDQNSGSANNGKSHILDESLGSLFEPEEVPTDKYRQFVKELRDHIESQAIVTEKDVMIFTYKRGMLTNHANDVVKELQAKGHLHPKIQVRSSSSTVKKEDPVFLKGGNHG